MLDIFSGLRLVVKRRNISIDNAIFRCHWFFTSTLLISFSLVITARQYVGQPIECHSIDKIPDSLLNSYCWVQSTFTIPQACNQQIGFEVPYPCIDNTRGREIKMFSYYQWVGIALFFQGLLFHLPYYMWKVWENGLIKAITGGLRIAVLSDQERAKKRDIVVDYIHDHLGCHKRYASKYFICEFVCLLNLLGQLWATNKFFDGQFLRYGIDVLQYSSSKISSQFGISPAQQPNNHSSNQQLEHQHQQSINSQPNSSFKQQIIQKIPDIGAPNSWLDNQRRLVESQRTEVDPMTYIFPRMTKCTYYDFGSSGDVQKHDALCLLPLNIINEKIYIALWFWFLILAILTLLVIVYRLFAIVSESVRCKGLISRCKLSSEIDIRIICRHCDVGDWFLFYMVAENLDPLIMREIVASVADKIRAHLELKRALGLGADQTELSDEDIRKYKGLFKGEGYRANSFDNQTLTAASTRRNSLADQVPMASELVSKIKKRFHYRRLMSTDSSHPSDVRQQLFRQSSLDSAPQSGLNPEHSGNFVGVEQTTGSLIVSAPPISQMPLDSMASSAERRARLVRSSSNQSSSGSHTSDSYIMEMPTISGQSFMEDELARMRHNSITDSSDMTTNFLADQSTSNNRRGSFHGRPQLIRQRRLGSLSNYRGHQHHSSLSSIRELRQTNQQSTTDGVEW